MSTRTVKAKKVRSDCEDGVGDSIPGLDSGYVYARTDTEDEVEFTLHDAQGDEFYLTCPRNMPITIKER